ncbi:phosphonates-binding periplasmic protein [Terrihabitans soli]|uniref:Phosphonates-binding periplasmic protein n=1 Tax=Terrihabitans soli TaxID=708113 RepID=A0A6S6QP56_9HYPH|nr:phosphonate ABC transporter substrate-binding protein [Terrihabitans soli]BCJ89697.1 phosphonates-binding periplasmic protein [Terrihabitans soli]
MKKFILGGLAALALAGTASAEDIKQLNFGIISTESSAALSKSFEPMLKDLEKAVGVPVKAYFAQDYAGVIEGMRFKKVDLAWYGNKSAMEAVDRAGGEVFVQTTKKDGSKGYYSLLLVNKSRTDLNEVKDVLDCSKGLNFGNGDANSTSGNLVPSYYVFAINNVNPSNCYKNVAVSNHEGNALAVAMGQVDFATNNTESMDRLAQSRPDDFAKIKEIWRSPLIPSDPLVWRKDLPSDVKAKIHSFFLGYGRLGTPEEVSRAREILKTTSDGWGPFVASSDAQLYPIRQLELFKSKLKIQNDEKLSADEKKSKTAEIDGKLADLSKLMETTPNM